MCGVPVCCLPLLQDSAELFQGNAASMQTTDRFREISKASERTKSDAFVWFLGRAAYATAYMILDRYSRKLPLFFKNKLYLVFSYKFRMLYSLARP